MPRPVPSAAPPRPPAPAAPHPTGATHDAPPCLIQALDASDNAVIITDQERRIVHVNHGFTRMLGFEPAEVRGRTPAEVLLGRHSDPSLVAAIHLGMETQGLFHGDALVYGRGELPRWVAMVINTIAGGSSISVLTDITLTKMHETLQQRVLESMANDLPLPELMQLVCREVERIAPEVTASVLSVDSQGMLHPLAGPRLPAHIHPALDGMRIGPAAGACGTAAFRGEPVTVTDMATDPLFLPDYWPIFASSGLRACWSSPIKNHQGQVVGTFAFYFHEPRGPSPLHQRLVEVCLHLCALAIERHAIQAQLHQLAFFDVLTGLPNRAMFRTTAERLLQSLTQQATSGALVFLDLDRFKQVNDSQGHAAGDALLAEVARRLSGQLRPGELAGRLSGDEFVLLLAGGDADTNLARATDLLQAVATPLTLQGQTRQIQASAGVALYPLHGVDIDTLLRHADLALYQAKGQRDPVPSLFHPHLGLQASERTTLEQALRQALAERALSLHYQPQVLAGEPHRLHGVEALARWHHPVLGAIGPDRFIPVAEDSGLIHALTEWALDTACQQLQTWRQQGLAVPRVALNLSAQSFCQAGFAAHITTALQRHGLAPSDLVLEITESVMMDARPNTLANVEQLHQAGLQLSLDDFGTGYSSLSYLHRLPIRELKLDRSFVQDLGDSAVARALTLSVLSIAHSLHVTVVAEGVETAEQARWLTEQGCPILQGYRYARPMAGNQLAGWLLAQDPASAPAG